MSSLKTIAVSGSVVVPAAVGMNLKIVTYTGDGAASHVIALGVVPKMIVVYTTANAVLPIMVVDFTNSHYRTAGAAETNDYLDDSLLAFATVFPSNSQIDVGAIQTKLAGNSWNFNGTAYRLFVYS